MDPKLQEFILSNADSDTNSLLLKQKQFPHIDMEIAVRCIHGRKKIASKLPHWLSYPDLMFPAALSLEQSSSEATALYKQRFVTSDDRVADLTGGFGADSYYFSSKVRSVDYFERNAELVECVKENFRTMGCENISVRCMEVNAQVLESLPDDSYDLVYLDPARRGKAGQRVFSINDCEPDVSLFASELLRIAPKVLVKVSPMADISALYSVFPQAVEFHVLSVGNECKEVLMLLDRMYSREAADVQIIAVETSASTEYRFTLAEERSCVPVFAKKEDIHGYLYEPYACITKSGAFKLLTRTFGVKKIASDSHFYVSDVPVEGFPGKMRKIEGIYDINKEFFRSFRKSVPECSVTARNVKMTSEELAKKMGTKESSRYRLFATSASDGSKIGILTIFVP